MTQNTFFEKWIALTYVDNAISRSKLILYVTGKTVTILLFTVEFKTTENDNKA